MTGTAILVVDDAPVNLRLMRLLLTHEGYEVRTAERAEDALEMLSNYRPELILADIQLPGMDGLEMTRHVKENPRTNPIRVVALTACNTKEDRERAFRAGCDDYITKPIDTSSLAVKVRELLARPPAEPAVPAQTGLAADGGPSVSGPAVEGLRQAFLDEGAGHSRQFLDRLGSGIDAVRAAHLAHEWIGGAGLLGYTEIASLARRAEGLLRAEPLNLYQLRVVFTDLLLVFTDKRDSSVAPVPKYIEEAIAEKRIALIGFTTERADAMCAILERVKARPRIFDVSDDLDSEVIRQCDLVLFHVRPETWDGPWLQTGTPATGVKKLIFTGDQQDLNGLPADVRWRAMDFLVGRGEPQEVLMRLALALSRDGIAVRKVTSTAIALSATASVGSDLPARETTITRPNVVLADDDQIVRSLVGSTLLNHGMCCRSVDNGRDALSLIRQEPPHAALLDVRMPGMDGFEVLAAIRADKIPTRVILLTSLQQEKDVLQAFKLGADDYVTKPFNPFELVARLKRLFQR